MRYSVFTVVVLCLLLAGISSVVSQRGRLRAGRPSSTIGCRYAGYRSCCKRGSCYVPRGNCYCDVKCHLYRDCCFDIFKISCGELIIFYYYFFFQFQLLFGGGVRIYLRFWCIHNIVCADHAMGCKASSDPCMQVVALLKVVLLGVAAAGKSGRFAIRVRESAGVMRRVGSSGTVVKTSSWLAAVSLSIHAAMSNL